MKKSLLLISILMLYVVTSFGKIWTVTNSGFAFSPATITIIHGDTVDFNIESIHNAVEVSQETWNANGATPLSGGFSLPDGGGRVLGLAVGTHYYVCTHHVAASQMKGIIIVSPAAGINKISGIDLFNLKIYPVPAKNIFTANYTLTETSNIEISIIDLTGKTVKNINFPKQLPGIHKLGIDINNLSGEYYIKLTDRKNTYFKKLTIL